MPSSSGPIPISLLADERLLRQLRAPVRLRDRDVRDQHADRVHAGRRLPGQLLRVGALDQRPQSPRQVFELRERERSLHRSELLDRLEQALRRLRHVRRSPRWRASGATLSSDA
jgi:hypothetical protein